VLYASSNLIPSATVSMDEDTAWRMFTKGISLEALQQKTQITGQQALGEVLLKTVAILA
jgi:hypothetical protein